MSEISKLNSSSSELDLDRPNLEDYLPTGSIHEPHAKLRLRDLLDISPTLTEAAGAIVDGAFELGCTVCPIAIKYNKIFVDAFWNSRKVRDIISVRAGLKKVPWDGYLKNSRPSPKHKERKQQSFAELVLRHLEEK